MSAPDRRALRVRVLREVALEGFDEPSVIICLVCATLCQSRFDRTEVVIQHDGQRWYRDIRTWRHLDGTDHRMPKGSLYQKL